MNKFISIVCLACIFAAIVGYETTAEQIATTDDHVAYSNVPTVKLVSSRSSYGDDQISSVTIDGDGALFATLSTDANILQFDKSSRKWSAIESYPPNNWAMNRILFLADGTGIAIGNHGTLAKIGEGDRAWRQLPRVSDLHLTDISFVDPLNGYIIGGIGVIDRESGALTYRYSIYRSDDSGETWSEIFQSNNEQVFGLIAFSKETLVASLSGPYLIRTEDAGKTWNRDSINSKGAKALAIDSNGNGWLVSWKGEILKSFDKGRSWNSATSIPPELSQFDWWDISFDNLGNGCAVAEEGILAYTIDNGANWKTLRISDRLREVRMQNKMAIVLGAANIFEIRF